MDIDQILTQARTGAREAATQQLKTAEENNLALYMALLAVELNSNDKAPENRQLAGLLMKNAIHSTDENDDEKKSLAWLNIPAEQRLVIKNNVFEALSCQIRTVRHSAAQICSRLGLIEIPKQQWLELIPTLSNVTSTTQDPSLKEGSLLALGYICEEIDSELMESMSNAILNAIVTGINPENPDICKAAIDALLNSLSFARKNFEIENERNYIMEIICKACSFPIESVRVVSFQCLVRIASLYYIILEPYMTFIFNLTVKAIAEDSEAVALQAVEFWSTICDEENTYIDDEDYALFIGERSKYFIEKASPFLVPYLLRTLTNQPEEIEDDTWTLAMASGTCLTYISQTIRDKIIDLIMEFVNTNLVQPDWRKREAATYAFSSILEGPDGDKMKNLIGLAIPAFLQQTTDSSSHVRDTTAWGLMRIVQFHPDLIVNHINSLITAFGTGMKDSPSIARHCCWGVYHFYSNFYQDDSQTNVLSQYFVPLLKELMVTSDRHDASDNNLRHAAYEAINSLIQNSANDTTSFIYEALPIFLEKLSNTFINPPEECHLIQAHLCSVLQVSISRLNRQIIPFADRIMELFMKAFSVHNTALYEEALLAITPFIAVLEKDFTRYIQLLSQPLFHGLANCAESSICYSAVGVVADLTRAIGADLVPYCDVIVDILLSNLKNEDLDRDVKPSIISCFGDIALGIGIHFEKYSSRIFEVLNVACNMNIEDDDEDAADYINAFHQSIFEAYSGIVQGMSEAQKGHLVLSAIPPLMKLLDRIWRDNIPNSLVRVIVGAIGDIAHCLSPHSQNYIATQTVARVISYSLQINNDTINSTANWAKQAINFR